MIFNNPNDVSVDFKNESDQTQIKQDPINSDDENNHENIVNKIPTTKYSINEFNQPIINEKKFYGTRAQVDEFESNNDYLGAQDISSVARPINVNGNLLTPNDIDIFKIDLKTEYNSVDNLTVQLDYLNSNNWPTYYSIFYISIWGYFEKEYLLIKTDSIEVIDWQNIDSLPPLTIQAFDSGYYYIKLSATNTYSYADDPINYRLKITTKLETAEDDNQVLEDAHELNGPISKKSVRMDNDLFDWYFIDTQDPINYSTNFSFTIEIIKTKQMKTQNINGQFISFVTELHIVTYYQIITGLKRIDEEIVGNTNKKFGHDNPIRFHYHYGTTFQLRFYIGVYVQTYGRDDSGFGQYLYGDGYCDGWAEYLIKKIQAKPMIPPVLSDAKVQEPVGKVYNTFSYFVTYSDENNDPPKTISITIDNNKIGPEPMTKINENDNNYQDGCVYKYSINGNRFDQTREEHEFTIFTEDVEVRGERLDGIGPIITDNILPTVRPSSMNQYLIYEDDPISYIDLNTTFEDPDNDTLFFRLSSNNWDWSKVYNSENITIRVITIKDDEGISRKYLEFKPKKNRYNRLQGQKFGSEILYINVSDDDPSNPKFPDQFGNVSRAHYIWNPFELEVIIIDINDPPQIRSPFKYQSSLTKGEMILDEDQQYIGFNLGTVFWDPIENDPLKYIVRNSNNINVRFYRNITGDFMDILPKENWTGTESIEIIADDGEAWVSDSLKIKINSVNDNPYLNYTPKQIMYEDKWFNITFIGYDHADSEPIYFETNLIDLLELTEEEYKFNTLTGELRFKPDNRHVGTYKNIWIKVKDYNDGESSQYLIFEIRNSPDPPEPKILSPANNARFLDVELIDFQGEFFDPDDEILVEPHTFTWGSNIDGTLSRDNNFRTILSSGEHDINLTITDNVLNGSTTIRISVLSESKEDKDNDEIPDYWEKLHYLNDNNPHDAKEDPDSDTYTNLEEYLGYDGKIGGNDDTDPNNPNSHPEKHIIKKEEKSEPGLIVWIILIIIIIIILILVYTFIIQKHQRNLDTKADRLELKPKKKIIWQDMFGHKYEVYSYEPNEIVCYNCLNKMEIQIPIRPLVITCNKCKKRGVLYK